MKTLKKLLFIFLAISFAFCFFACGGKGDTCKTHLDENNDGKCDKCGETVKNEDNPVGDLVLVEDGEAKFQIVYADGMSSMLIGKINKLKTELLGVGISVERVADKADNIKDCEILIGNITARGDKYKTDGHDYGMEGYVIKIIGSKLIINAGSEEALIDAIDVFLENIVEIDDDEKDFENLVVKADMQVEVVQDDYKVTSLSVDGKDMKGYTIAVEKTEHNEAAKALQQTVYERTGYWFKIVSADKAADSSIIIKSVAKDAVEGGFKISVNAKKQLVIECAYENMLQSSIEDFLSDKVVAAKGAVDFKGTVYTDDISVVYYKDFGAKGDGRTDDFFALKAAHDFANISGQTVKADSGKTYYIHETRVNGKGAVQYISVKTNVDWGTAKFIIDDATLSGFDGTGRSGKDIFIIEPDTEVEKIVDTKILKSVVEAGLGKGTEKIDIGLDKAVMIIPYNTSHKVYRRKNYSAYMGTSMHEVIVIDKDGNVDGDTPVMFDYSNVDYIEVYFLDDEPLTISGGIFTTKASAVDIVYFDKDGNKAIHDTYFQRGIEVKRSYTKVKNVQHYVEGEITVKEQLAGKLGTAYNGFFGASYANEVTFEDCVLTGRRCYNKSSSAGLSGGTTGTYDFRAGRVNKIILKNCTQSNFFVELDEENRVTATTEDNPKAQLSMISIPGTSYQLHWGAGCTDFCKNMEFIGSTIARFDAHQGLYNGKIIDSTVNYIAITGGGNMIIENSRWFAAKPDYNANSLIHLREDYGSTWDGTVSVKNVQAYVFTKNSAGNDVDTWLVMHQYKNWYHGYTSVFPSIEIDNLDYYDIETKAALPAGYEIKLCGSSMTGEPALHLEQTLNKVAYLPDVDNDNDGFVDGTEIEFDGDSDWNGVATSSKENLNPIKPPEFIKITGNDGISGGGGYIYVIPRTDGFEVSDGGYYDSVENFGGFFGDTKFITENNTYLGTNHENAETFMFK